MAASAPARLFYDPGCGPCTFFARVSEWASHSRVRALPYDGPEAMNELGDLGEEFRYAYAHLVDAGGRRSGAGIMSPLVGLAFGSAAERVVSRVSPLDRSLDWLYTRFWNYRRTHGCGADSVRAVS